MKAVMNQRRNPAAVSRRDLEGEGVLFRRPVAGDQRPDVLVVVLDCVRAQSLRPWGKEGVTLPFLSGLAKKATVYSRCLSVASWSLPAHASLFTGRYPWNHHVYGRSFRTLGPAIPTLAQELKALGYETLSLSANPFLCDKTGLTAGFDSTYWADWSSHYLRFLGSHLPPFGHYTNSLAERDGIHVQSGRRRLLLKALDLSNLLAPHAWRTLLALDGRVRRRMEAHAQCSSPWIEPALARWLDKIPIGRPVCCLVNLMDAHEPYLNGIAEDPSLGLFGRGDKLLVDGTDIGAMGMSLDESELRELERRYLDCLVVLDKRLEGLVQLFATHRKLDSALLVVTSDHGQSFGERGHLFHGRETGDDLLRVPLLVKFPQEDHAGILIDSWTSLVDLLPTIRAEAGGRPSSAVDGRVLPSTPGVHRGEPVLALGDDYGLIPRSRVRSDGRRILREHLTIVGWLEGIRAEVNGKDSTVRIRNQETHQLMTIREFSERMDTSETDRTVVERLARVVASVLGMLSEDRAVDRRLTGWGY